MRYIHNTGKKIVISALALLTFFSACKKNSEFFDIKDPQGIDSRIWSDEGAVGLFLNRTYGLVMPQWPTGGIHVTSDESNNATTTFLYGTLVENSVQDIGTGNTITTNRYFDIRRCNIAIEGLNSTSTLPEATRKTLKGQFFFLRAFVYFRLVSLYGGVPLVLKSQTLEDELNVPRAKTSECIAAIVKDLDSATAYLPAAWGTAEKGRITRAASSAMKGKVLMYWASPQFNPTNIVSRWEDAYQANLAAYNQCIADGISLFPTYANIFTVEDNVEVLLVRKYSAARDVGTNTEAITRPDSETDGPSGSNQPTWNLVQAYGMRDGLPTGHASSGYNNIMFWQNRDPRFEASIAYNGGAWALSGKATRKQWSHTGVPDEAAGTIVTGFYLKRFTNPTLTPAQSVYNSNSGGGSGMDWIEMRFAEVVLNLAECANETNRLAEAKDNVRRIRQRAGIVAGSFDYGLDVATDIVSMRNLILNERMVEFALEGKRHMDLRRTRNYGLISARQSYKLSAKPPYYPGTTRSGALPTDIFLDKPDAFGVRPRDTANLNNQSVYTTIYVTPGNIASLEGSNSISIPAKYYFYALPNFFSQNFFLEQTSGWINGTFDPLQ
ncbi:RagB/SusD family nutrient uptake outer membrane protein [Lacibacter sp. H375]|uniref:RagB/SusD family nutrient uptake outer membrane protein n=1 Tax=Lacibacter sp. H375 TaxID=3133424 RepID=UPI0030BF8CE7